MNGNQNQPFDDRQTAGLQVYLLGMVEFEVALALQRRLVYEIGEDRSRAALILCQHPPLITVGRQGSFRHILADPEEMRTHRLRTRWVNRGGGCQLHMPGQLAVYPILPLDRLQLGPHECLHRLQEVLAALLSDFMVRAETRPHHAGVWAGRRLIAAVGLAVRDWVTYYGAALNVNPALDPFRLVHCGGPDEPPMTSLERERRGPLSPTLVRQRLVEHFANRFGFAQTFLFTEHPALNSPATRLQALALDAAGNGPGAGKRSRI